MAFRITDEDCIACGACETVCPVSCITEKEDGKRIIDEKNCIDCGGCSDVCPVACIYQV